MRQPSTERYGVVARLLHWSIAALIFTLLALGWYMVGLTYFDRWYNAALSWHRVLGLLVLTLALTFLLWRQIAPSPPLPTTISRAQQVAANAAHHLLFTLMVLIPVTGYLVSTSAGKSIEVFGWFAVPPLIDVNDTLRELAIKIHFYCAYGTGLLALGHAGAALKHQFIDKDGILSRML